MKVYVLAGTCAQAEHWARERGIQKPDLYHVISSRSLAGLRPGVLHLVGTALRDRHDVQRTLDWARAVGWEIRRERRAVEDVDLEELNRKAQETKP